MRSVCCAISLSTRSRSTGVSGSEAMVSTKPASTVSGVRISCETLATKSRRIASARSRSVTSSDSTRRRPSPYSRTMTEKLRRPSGSTRDSVSEKSPACRNCTKAGWRTRLVTRWRRSRTGSRPKWSAATELHHSIWPPASSSMTPLGEASIADRNCSRRSRSRSICASRWRSARSTR
ncbi:hypothetical protein RBXJA2T_09737 [Rubrivivax benzoatilyticus JA2 = ATCC BAA-35]|nr:hypothetical protein RBXJA2T_09737 [Rubrivivax benzoatilyticus JA2 = ATCC BAA-35]